LKSNIFDLSVFSEFILEVGCNKEMTLVQKEKNTVAVGDWQMTKRIDGLRGLFKTGRQKGREGGKGGVRMR
jgi:hypothetical protein